MNETGVVEVLSNVQEDIQVVVRQVEFFQLPVQISQVGVHDTSKLFVAVFRKALQGFSHVFDGKLMLLAVEVDEPAVVVRAGEQVVFHLSGF